MDQINDQKPPPNPAKTTDARFASYMRQYGDESWELDALRPQYLDDLVREHITEHIETAKWTTRVAEIAGLRKKLTKVADDFRRAA